MEIMIIAQDDVDIDDIEQAFKDHAGRAQEHHRKFYLTARTFPASKCRNNDKHILFIKKEELK